MINIEIILSILAGIISVSFGGIFQSSFMKKLLSKILKIKYPLKQEMYSERLSKLTTNLQQSSAEVDNIIIELSQVAKERESAINKLENQLKELEIKEQSMQNRIQQLKNVPIPVADYFANISSRGEKRSAHRDYLLFGCGVLVSTIISIIFFLLQK